MIDLIQGVLACLQDGCWREGMCAGTRGDKWGTKGAAYDCAF